MAGGPKIGDLLVAAGSITAEQLTQALQQQKKSGGRLGTNLVELGFIDESTLAKVLAKQLKIPAATAAQLDKIRQDVLKRIPAELAQRLSAVPVREDSGMLWVALVDPTDRTTLQALANHAKIAIRPMIAPELLIQFALEKHYRVKRKPRTVELSSVKDGVMMIEGQQRGFGSAPDSPMASAVNQGGLDVDSLFADVGDVQAPPPQAQAEKVARPTFEQMINRWASATHDEAIARELQNYFSGLLPKRGVFIVRQNKLTGWFHKGLWQSDAEFSQVAVELRELPMLMRLLASPGVYTGLIGGNMLGPLAQAFGVTTQVYGIIFPILLNGRPLGCLIGTHAEKSPEPLKPELDRLSTRLDLAMQIRNLKRMLLQP